MINICFHGIGTPQRELEPGEAPYWVTHDSYRRVVDEVAEWPWIAISFDDGNASDVELGLAPLLDRGLTASFYMVADRIGCQGSLDEGALRLLREHGMTVGTHGMHHRPWTGLHHNDLHVELVDARQRIEDAAGAPINHAALPFGRYDRRVLGALRRLGYERVYSSDQAPANVDAWFQPRYSVTDEDTIETLRARVLQRQGPRDRVRGTVNRWRKSVR